MESMTKKMREYLIKLVSDDLRDREKQLAHYEDYMSRSFDKVYTQRQINAVTNKILFLKLTLEKLNSQTS